MRLARARGTVGSRRHHRLRGGIPLAQFELPPLPYPYDALEPHIDEQTMRLHHDIHHKSYVDGLNNAVAKLAEAREKGDFALVKHWEREAAFHGSGHFLHTIFWEIMGPNAGGTPTGAIADQINRDFGSFDAFKKHFSAAAAAVEGSGWGLLVWQPQAQRLEVLTAEKHQNLTQWGVVPLLVLDVWEHAYYLKYQNRRPAYIEAWWNVVNWPAVNQRFEEARR
ncbi:MAG: superoxide dismutase [Clostridia bacterium]|nr:superoxide dismutase [Clostridia bacterium]